MDYQHIVLTRFSLTRRTDSVARRDKSGKRQAWFRDPLSESSLRLRLFLLEHICLPSIRGQSDQNFTWIIITDPEMPAKYHRQISELLSGNPNYRNHVRQPKDKLKRLGWIEPYRDREKAYLITTNLDSDDALPTGFVSALKTVFAREQARGRGPFFFLAGISAALQWDLVFSRRAPLGWACRWHRKAVRTPSCGFSLIAPTKCNLNILAGRHRLAEAYTDYSRGTRECHVKRARKLFAKQPGDSARWLPFLDLSPTIGPSLVSNHGDNLQAFRLFEKKESQWPMRKDLLSKYGIGERPFEKTPGRGHFSKWGNLARLIYLWFFQSRVYPNPRQRNTRGFLRQFWVLFWR